MFSSDVQENNPIKSVSPYWTTTNQLMLSFESLSNSDSKTPDHPFNKVAMHQSQ